MEETEPLKQSPGRFAAAKRRPVSLSQADLVRAEALRPGEPLPLVVRPAVPGVDLADWAAGNRPFIEERLLRHGALLFRDFPVRAVSDFERFARAVSPELLRYEERSSPRHQVGDNIYTSTDYPADQSIFFHNENSYQQAWPRKLFFHCVTPAERGGQTPLADVRRVYEAIDPEVRRRFAERRWMLVRNFDGVLGLPWQTVFQTDDRAAVEAHCRRAGIGVEWREGGRLRTRVVRPAVVTHPATGEPLWFNHLTFFHVSTLGAAGAALLSAMAEEDLPSNTFYGDGSPIEPEVLEHLRAAYRRQAVIFDWQRGDVLLLDNMLTAHAREPFAGARQVVVGMAEPFTRQGA